MFFVLLCEMCNYEVLKHHLVSRSFSSGVNDGLMGLAFPAISSYPATPFFNTLIANGAVDAGQFGFYLASSGSELYLGGSDTSLYSGDISWNAVTQEVCLNFTISPSCAHLN